MAANDLSNSKGIEAPIPVGNNSASTRYFGLDAVRASAMLLGVLYHAILFGGGMMMGLRGAGGAATVIMNWIHCFRMPLFFLISGFFCHMMLEKYGVGRYFLRRWTRIGIPFLLVLFVLAGIRTFGPQNAFPFGGGGPGPRPRQGPAGVLPGGGPGFGRPPGAGEPRAGGE